MFHLLYHTLQRVIIIRVFVQRSRERFQVIAKAAEIPLTQISNGH
jgi:hypothetical protein